MKHYLTKEEQKDAEVAGALAELKAAGGILGPCEIVSVIDKQKARLRQIAKDKQKAMQLALPHPRHADESWFSLVSSIKNAQSAMKKARRLHPDCTVISAPDFLRKKSDASLAGFIDSMLSEDDLQFFNEAATALIKRDSKFFERVAEVLEKGADKGPDDRWIKYMHEAYRERLGSAPDVLPTKKEVRELAVRKRATDDVWNRSNQKAYKDKSEFARVRAKEIGAAMRIFIKADPAKDKKEWTERFKKAGLNALLGDKGGRPSKRMKANST